jgi:hypothetical protein
MTTVSEDQNTITYEGIRYEARDMDIDSRHISSEMLRCNSCDLRKFQKCELFPCLPRERKDGSMVTFMFAFHEKRLEKYKYLNEVAAGVIKIEKENQIDDEQVIEKPTEKWIRKIFKFKSHDNQ